MYKKERIVIALGGNALGNTPQEQLEAARKTAASIVDIIEAGHEVAIAHGNGPQVGMINLAMEIASKQQSNIPEMPFPECNAMSQGYIGFHLQNAIGEEIAKRGLNIPIASIITQVIVDPYDPAFKNPTKPIGSFYTQEEAWHLQKTKGYTMIEDAGRGYRRVVPSPKPVDIVEKDTIKALIEAGNVVITVGGGGIPVIRADNRLIGISAVIDKDFASAKLADLIHADRLIILTAVEKVAINFGKPNEQWLSELSVEEAHELIKEGHFAAGSMLPKVQAAIEFVKGNPDRKALITSLEKAKEGIEGLTGTVITSQGRRYNDYSFKSGNFDQASVC